MHLATTPEEQRRWMEQWRAAAAALEEARIAELASLTEEEAWEKGDSLLAMPGAWRNPTDACGLIIQQSIFSRGHVAK